MSVVTGQIYLGSTASLMARVSSSLGADLKLVDISLISCKVKDLDTDLSSTFTVSAASSIFDTLQPWPGDQPDAEGYNFRYELPPSYMPVAGRFYQVVFTFTLTDTTTATAAFELQVLPVRALYEQEADLGVTYGQLRSEIARYLGWTRDFTEWTTEESATIEDLIRNGLRQFYWPGPLQDGNTIRWSFLSPQATITLADANSVYQLPADFGGNARSFSYEADSAIPPPTEISEQQIRLLRSSKGEWGSPSYFAIRPKSSTGMAVQTWEIVFYPTPRTAHTLTYRYDIVPPMLSELAPYPLGGAMHAKTIIESCLALAEEWSSDKSGLHRERFAAYMANSAKIDGSMAPDVPKDTWPITHDATLTLDLTYFDIQKHVGQVLDYGWDRSKWSRDQVLLVDELIQSGLRQFYQPKPLEGQPPHVWSFLLTTDALVTSAGTSAYDMPECFTGNIIGDMHFSTGEEQTHVQEISEDRLRDMLTDHHESGPPEYVCIRAKKSDGQSRQRWEAIFYPAPSAVHSINFRYRAVPYRLTVDAPYPMGGVDHAETILASCMSAAEERIKGGTQFKERYTALLGASITTDSRKTPSDVTWPLADKGETTLDITYGTLLKRVGNLMGFGWDVAAWSTEERRRVDMAIQDGLRQFYNPLPLPGEQAGHDWSFLRPMGSIECVSGTYIYDLPQDYSAIIGPITFAQNESVVYSPIEIIGEHQIRARLANDHSASRPMYACTKSKKPDGQGPLRWELWLFPVPDGDYVLDFCYRVNAMAIDSNRQYPLGAQMHAQTIIEACLSAAEELMGSTSGGHAGKFKELLFASVGQDRKASAPAYLGYNRDSSDRPGFGTFNYHRECDNLTSYNGVYY
jgi:hypothetical protein